MKKLFSLIFIGLIALYATSCSSGYSAYKKGDYYNASLDAIKRLRSSPTNKKAQFVLTNAYPLAIKSAERAIENAQLANNSNTYDILVAQYQQINILANEITACPKALELIPSPMERVVELENAKKNAAEQAYQMGVKSLDSKSLEDARIAYQYFTKCNQYVNDYKDVSKKINESRYYATLRIIVQKPLTSNRYQYSADFFFTNLITEMSKATQNRLVRFYTPDEAAAERMNDPHQLIVLDFIDFSVGDIKETINSKELSRDSVIVGTVKVDGKNYNSYNTVKAKLTTYRRELRSHGVLAMRFVDAKTNRDLQIKTFAGEYVWHTDWASFNGDERALSSEEKQLCTSKPRLQPSSQDLFVEFTRPIFSQSVNYIWSVYNKY